VHKTDPKPALVAKFAATFLSIRNLLKNFASGIRCSFFLDISGGQTGEWALVQEEQMGPLLTPGKISLNR